MARVIIDDTNLREVLAKYDDAREAWREASERRDRIPIGDPAFLAACDACDRLQRAIDEANSDVRYYAWSALRAATPAPGGN